MNTAPFSLRKLKTLSKYLTSVAICGNFSGMLHRLVILSRIKPYLSCDVGL